MLNRKIAAILDEERRHAETMARSGDFGRAKLIVAAADMVEAVLRAAEREGAVDRGRLSDALWDARRRYRELWSDEDDVGASVFGRILGLVGG